MIKFNTMSLIQPTTKNTDKKKKGNILQFLKKIDNTDLLDSTHNINKQQIQENICDDEFEKNNKEFFESVKQVKLKDKINKTVDNQKESIGNESDDKINNNKLSKLDKYKQFKNIDPDFTIQKYDINLKSNTISHLTFEEIEYKFCSQCVKWNNITNYHIYNSAVDKLNKYCKSCSNQLKKNNENAKKKNY